MLEGELVIELLESPPLILKPNDFYAVPKGTVHRTIARGRTVNLCIEATNADTVFVEGS